ncbi:conserved hypothetical protein [Sporisorium reilianum SRZ2]|uniref:Uncharacterized protein n=1 Tax=Sporisorium reilianum (strain SRZ2) TaxID=999809 RepID=E6ZVY6_SPORE|nr:conserved hypothetical protein [Sporisorium reilianum SRZ2]
MGKKTKKQKQAQKARQTRTRYLVSHTQKQVKTLSLSKSYSTASQAASIDLQHAPDTYRTLGNNQDASKTNLLLRDSHTDNPLLMRISPTSVYKQDQARQAAETGYQCLKEFKESIPMRQTRGLFELGIYHSVGQSYLGFMKANKQEELKKEAWELLKWARDYSAKHLLTIRTLLPAEWRKDMESQEKKEFLKKLFKKQADLLSPWWTTITFFNSFTGKAHFDHSDHTPSFLFNFGAPCLLVLHNYKVKVQLNAFGIAVFGNRQLHHSTLPTDEDGERWAFSAFYRKAIYNEQGPSQIGKDVLDAVLGQEEEKPQIRGANK